MPKKGWKAITVKQELADLLEEEARKHGRTIPQQIEHLVEGSAALEVSEEDREILRSTLYQIAQELKAKNPGVSVQEIREWLKELIDVTV
jgi:hypothetical protein